MDAGAEEGKPQRKDEELLILAAHHGFVEDVKTQVAKGVDPCSVDKKGTSAIHFAASKGHLDVVLFLLSKGVDIDMEDQSGRSPLHYAVLGESNEVVKALMKKSAWIDAYDKDDDTPLHLAARQGSEPILRTLLKGGAKVNIHNQKSLTALGDALANKKVDMAKILLENGADVMEKAKGFSLLHLVAGLGDPATLSFTLAYLHPNKVPGPGGVTPLHCAAIGESQECVKILLDHGADPIKPDDDGRTAYFWAKGSKADQDILKLLARGSKEASKSDEETKIPGGPEAEWGAFVEMTRDEQMKQVEAWANCPEELGPLGKLSFLNPDGRKAVSQVGHFMREIECRKAIRSLQVDEDFQDDVASQQVQTAVSDVTQNPQLIEKYMSDPKVMGVLQKLKTLQNVLRHNGHKKIVFDELVASEGSSSNDHEPSLEEQLKDAKDAVVNAVMNDLMEQEKALKNDPSQSSTWFGGGGGGGGGNFEGTKLGKTWGMRKVGQELLRSLWVSFVILAIFAAVAWYMKIGIFSPRGTMQNPQIVDEATFHRIAKGGSKSEL